MHGSATEVPGQVPAMILVVAAVVVIVALTTGVAVASVRTGRNAENPPASSDEWLGNARTVVRDGYVITAGMTESAERSPTDLTDDVIARIVSEIKGFITDLAGISAAAPTAMDTRVCREVGVRANALCAVYERELRVREALGAEHRSALAGDTLQQPARRLEEFEVALRDLDEHVELL